MASGSSPILKRTSDDQSSTRSLHCTEGFQRHCTGFWVNRTLRNLVSPNVDDCGGQSCHAHATRRFLSNYPDGTNGQPRPFPISFEQDATTRENIGNLIQIIHPTAGSKKSSKICSSLLLMPSPLCENSRFRRPRGRSFPVRVPPSKCTPCLCHNSCTQKSPHSHVW